MKKNKKSTPSTKRDVPLTYAQRMELEGEALPKKGAAQILRGLRGIDPQTLHLAASAHYGKDTSPNFLMDLPKMEAGDDSYERSGEEAFNMTPNVSEEEAKKVRDKFDATYMKSGSPKMINKLRNIGK